MYKILYFKDDHDRTLRVLIHKQTGKVFLHIYDQEGYTVPLPRSAKPRNARKFEYDHLRVMRDSAKHCPMFTKK